MLLVVKKEMKDVRYYVYQYYNGKCWVVCFDGLKNGVLVEVVLLDKLILDVLKDLFWDICSEVVFLVFCLKGDVEIMVVNQLKEIVKNDLNLGVCVVVVVVLLKKMIGVDKCVMLEDCINNDKLYMVIFKVLIEFNKFDNQVVMGIVKNFEMEKLFKMFFFVV